MDAQHRTDRGITLPYWIINCPEIDRYTTAKGKTIADIRKDILGFLHGNRLHFVLKSEPVKGPGHVEWLFRVELPRPRVPSLLSIYRSYREVHTNNEDGTTVRFRLYDSRREALTKAFKLWWMAKSARFHPPSLGW